LLGTERETEARAEGEGQTQRAAAAAKASQVSCFSGCSCCGLRKNSLFKLTGRRRGRIKGK
jgi:hypothetical protein